MHFSLQCTFTNAYNLLEKIYVVFFVVFGLISKVRTSLAEMAHESEVYKKKIFLLLYLKRRLILTFYHQKYLY